jgi:DNA-binding CsgD family transcriptional regulator
LATQRPYTHETSVPTHNILKLPPSVFQWLNQPPKPKTDKSIHQDHLTLSLNHLKIRFRVLSRVSDNEILLVIQEVQSETVERNGIAKLQSRLNLTSREAEVLYWLCMGKANRDIADILGISYRTVDKHLEHLFVKINVESRASAVASSVRILED